MGCAISSVRASPRTIPPVNFKGAIDDVVVWKVERTEAEIRHDMQARLTGKEPGLAADWNFGELRGWPGEGRRARGI